MGAEEIVRVVRVKVHQVIGVLRFFALGRFALAAQRGSDRLAFRKRFGEKGGAPFGGAHLSAEGLVGNVVGAQGIAVGEDELPARQGQYLRLVQQTGAAAVGETLAQQEIAVAMQDEDFGSGVAQVAEGRGHFGVEGVFRIVETVVARPSFKEVTENVELRCVARRPREVGKEGLRGGGILRREVQVRNEVDQDRSGPCVQAPRISRLRRAG